MRRAGSYLLLAALLTEVAEVDTSALGGGEFRAGGQVRRPVKVRAQGITRQVVGRP